MQIKLHANSKIKIWVQGHKEPIWVKVLELNDKGFSQSKSNELDGNGSRWNVRLNPFLKG